MASFMKLGLETCEMWEIKTFDVMKGCWAISYYGYFVFRLVRLEEYDKM